jgi:AcrR family transcriptional regulator
MNVRSGNKVVNVYIVVTVYLRVRRSEVAPSATRKPYHHGDLRSALLAAGEAMVERVGVEALSLRELTREIGVSNNAPRRHFPSKQVLLDALALQGFERLGAVLNRAASSEEPDFVRRLTKLAHAHIRFAVKHQSLFRLMFAAKQRPDAPSDLIEASHKALMVGPMTISYGQSIGEVVHGDAQRLAITVFAAVEGLISLSSGGKVNGMPIEKATENCIADIMLGLKPR